MKVLVLLVLMLVGCNEKECVVKYPEVKKMFEFKHDRISEMCDLFLNSKLSAEQKEELRLRVDQCDVEFRTLNSWYHRFEKGNCY